jgi:hypothetical protein
MELYWLTMSKTSKLSTSNDPCDTDNKHQTTICTNDVITQMMKCNLPWMKNQNPQLPQCDPETDLDLYKNILVNMSRQNPNEDTYGDCTNIINCQSVSWTTKDFTKMEYPLRFPNTSEIHLILLNIPSRVCEITIAILWLFLYTNLLILIPFFRLVSLKKVLVIHL